MPYLTAGKKVHRFACSRNNKINPYGDGSAHAHTQQKQNAYYEKSHTRHTTSSSFASHTQVDGQSSSPTLSALVTQIIIIINPSPSIIPPPPPTHTHTRLTARTRARRPHHQQRSTCSHRRACDPYCRIPPPFPPFCFQSFHPFYRPFVNTGHPRAATCWPRPPTHPHHHNNNSPFAEHKLASRSLPLSLCRSVSLTNPSASYLHRASYRPTRAHVRAPRRPRSRFRSVGKSTPSSSRTLHFAYFFHRLFFQRFVFQLSLSVSIGSGTHRSDPAVLTARVIPRERRND